jgi:ribosomal protein L19E
LCGARTSRDPEQRVVTDVDSYHTDLRALRDQLRKLREDAEAV